MKNSDTLYDTWQIDLRRIMFCVAAIVLGIIYNVSTPIALSVALIVQGMSNIDGIWDCLSNKELSASLKYMSIVTVLLSFFAVVFAVYSLSSSNIYFDLLTNKCAGWNIALAAIAVAFPLVLYSVDLGKNMKNEIRSQNWDNAERGDEDDE